MSTRVHPFGKRICVIDSPVKDERPSGLILPVGVDSVSVGICEDGNDSGIPDGALVYYHKGHGIEIQGVKVVDESCIVAWEQL